MKKSTVKELKEWGRLVFACALGGYGLVSLMRPLAQPAALVAPPPVGDVSLVWTYPTNELSTNLTFVLHGTNALVPLPWPVLTNIVGTSTNAKVRIQPGRFYFYVQSSNLWGVSDPSNVAATPPLPRSDVILTISGAQ